MDSVWGLVLCGGVPIFNLILITNFIKNLPEELEEAAKIDGAGPWRVMFQVIAAAPEARIGDRPLVHDGRALERFLSRDGPVHASRELSVANLYSAVGRLDEPAKSGELVRRTTRADVQIE